MTRPVKAHRYNSPLRTEQARATRRVILDAARALFLEQGYVTTTMHAIARKARVSPATVYKTFVTKASLVEALVDVSITGDDAAVPILNRQWVQDMRDEPNPRKRLRILARNGRMILERRASVDEVLRVAAAADADVASLYEQGKAQRLRGQRELLRIAGLNGAGAADTLYAIGSPEVFRLLTVDRGWSPDRFERWYAETLLRLLLS